MSQSTDASNVRGTEFEDLVADLLEGFRAKHPEAVNVERHPRINLQNGTVAIPDFELTYKLPHQSDHRIIECQDREKSSQDIAHKIRAIKSMSSKNRFILIFKDPDYLSESLRKALDADGIVYYPLLEFAAFLVELGITLQATTAPRPHLVDFAVGQPPIDSKLAPQDRSTILPAPFSQTFELAEPLAEEFRRIIDQKVGARAVDEFIVDLKGFSPKSEGARLSARPKKGPFEW